MITNILTRTRADRLAKCVVSKRIKHGRYLDPDHKIIAYEANAENIDLATFGSNGWRIFWERYRIRANKKIQRYEAGVRLEQRNRALAKKSTEEQERNH